MKRNVLIGWFLLSSAVALSGCGKKEQPQKAEATEVESEPPAAVAPAQLAVGDARQLFQSKCTVCHGSVGLGDGPGAAALTPKPRAFADAAWQNSVTDEQIGNTIIMGGAAVGKSPIMPPNPDLSDKPEVVKELVKIVRGFKKG